MARGIITKKPGGGSPNGRIIVTDTTISNPFGTGGGATDSTGAVITIVYGQSLNFTEDTKANVGDLVEFAVGKDITAGGIFTVTSGKLISGELQDSVQVNNGDVVYIADGSHIEGKIVVQGGVLVVGQNVHAEGKVESLIDNSFLFIDAGGHIEGKVAVTGASYFIMSGTVVEGKVSSANNIFASVVGCTIKGSLEVLSAKNCKCSGNSVEGKTNTPGCTA